MSTTLAADVVREIEARAGVDSLGDLHQRRRVLMETLAPLKALHGPFGLFDDRRKQMVEALKVRARWELTKPLNGSTDMRKTTEAAIDAAAYADEQYAALLDQALSEKVEYLKMETELSEIAERISSREAELYFLGKEMGLTR